MDYHFLFKPTPGKNQSKRLVLLDSDSHPGGNIKKWHIIYNITIWKILKQFSRVIQTRKKVHI